MMNGMDRAATDDEAALQGYAAALADAVEAVLPAWVHRCVVGRFVEATGCADLIVGRKAEAEGERARREVGAEIRRLLETDIDEQRTTPLALLRGAVRYATGVLREAGVPEVVRDDFAQRAFPDDVYDLAPATFADVDRSLHEPGIEWGAAKAHVHLRRRRASAAPRIAAYVPDLMDRSKVDGGGGRSRHVRRVAGRSRRRRCRSRGRRSESARGSRRRSVPPTGGSSGSGPTSTASCSPRPGRGLRPGAGPVGLLRRRRPLAERGPARFLALLAAGAAGACRRRRGARPAPLPRPRLWPRRPGALDDHDERHRGSPRRRSSPAAPSRSAWRRATPARTLRAVDPARARRRSTAGGCPTRAVAVPGRWPGTTRFAGVVAEGRSTATAALAHSVHVDVDRPRARRRVLVPLPADGYMSPVGPDPRPRPPRAPRSTALALRVRVVPGLAGRLLHRAAAPSGRGPRLRRLAGRLHLRVGPLDGGVRRARGRGRSDLAAIATGTRCTRRTPDCRPPTPPRPGSSRGTTTRSGTTTPATSLRRAATRPAFAARRAAAYQAWYEHQPVRLPPPSGRATRSTGACPSVICVPSSCSTGGSTGRRKRAAAPTGRCARGLDDPARTMLGAEQEAGWSPASRTRRSRMEVVANDVIMTDCLFQFGGDTIVNFDQWDGYPRGARIVCSSRYEMPASPTPW